MAEQPPRPEPRILIEGIKHGVKYNPAGYPTATCLRCYCVFEYKHSQVMEDNNIFTRRRECFLRCPGCRKSFMIGLYE